jgi:Flp pilus assembly pilin Flp
LVVLSGFNAIEFHLPSNVLMVIVGSTMIAAIGLVGWVVKGLFNAQK